MRQHRQIFASVGAVTCIAAVAASWAATGGTRLADSGLHGRVLFGPTCPVERVGQSCVRPYQAAIRVLREPAKRLLATVRSDGAGRFSVRLAPGQYLLQPQTGHPFPRSSPQVVTVHAHRYTSVTVSYDSGIR